MSDFKKHWWKLAFVAVAFCIVGTMDYEQEQRDEAYAQAYYDEVKQRYDFALVDSEVRR